MKCNFYFFEKFGNREFLMQPDIELFMLRIIKNSISAAFIRIFLPHKVAAFSVLDFPDIVNILTSLEGVTWRVHMAAAFLKSAVIFSNVTGE